MQTKLTSAGRLPTACYIPIRPMSNCLMGSFPRWWFELTTLTFADHYSPAVKCSDRITLKMHASDCIDCSNENMAVWTGKSPSLLMPQLFLARLMACLWGWHCLSVGRSVHHFGPEWNISTKIRGTEVLLGIHDTQAWTQLARVIS